MIIDMPTKLYHYTSFDVFLKFILPEKRLKFSRFGQSRDPYEFIPYDFEFGMFPYWQDDCTKSEQKELLKQLSGFNDYWTNSRFLSFVVEGPDIGIGSKKPRMWEQYGNRHDGVCLEFSFDQIIINFEAITSQLKFQGEIKYRQNLNPYSFLRDYLNVIQELSNPNYLKTSFKDLFFYKDEDYRQEKEYRFLVLNNDIENNFYLGISDCLTKIILGSGVTCDAQYLYKPIFEKIFPGVVVEKISWINGVAESSAPLY